MTARLPPEKRLVAAYRIALCALILATYPKTPTAAFLAADPPAPSKRCPK